MEQLCAYDHGLKPEAARDVALLVARIVLGVVLFARGWHKVVVDGVAATSDQFEAGIKYEIPGANAFLTVAAFDLALANSLTSDPTNPLNQLQLGETRSRGFEAQLGRAARVFEQGSQGRLFKASSLALQDAPRGPASPGVGG